MAEKGEQSTPLSTEEESTADTKTSTPQPTEQSPVQSPKEASPPPAAKPPTPEASKEPPPQSSSGPPAAKPPTPEASKEPPPQSSSGPPAAKPPTPEASKEPPPQSSSGPRAPETPQEKKAKEFLVQAEKKLKSSQTFFGGLFGGAAKMEDAADLFVRAANTFKVAKKWKEAGAAFCRAADVQMQLEVKHEAGTNLVEAGQVLKRVDPQEAVDCYLKAAEIYTDMGRFTMAARYHNNIAEICESELVDFEQAIAHYEQAADYYRGEDSTGSANRCLLKVAHMSAMQQHYDKAAGIFEEVGRNSLENNLLRYSAKDYFFKAAVCRFCMGVEDVKAAVEGYKQIHPGFEGTRELKLIQDLLEVHSEEDPDKFGDIVKNYDAISRIDAWLTTQLLVIKKSIHAEPDIN